MNKLLKVVITLAIVIGVLPFTAMAGGRGAFPTPIQYSITTGSMDMIYGPEGSNIVQLIHLTVSYQNPNSTPLPQVFLQCHYDSAFGNRFLMGKNSPRPDYHLDIYPPEEVITWDPPTDLPAGAGATKSIWLFVRNPENSSTTFTCATYSIQFERPSQLARLQFNVAYSNSHFVSSSHG